MANIFTNVTAMKLSIPTAAPKISSPPIVQKTSSPTSAPPQKISPSSVVFRTGGSSSQVRAVAASPSAPSPVSPAPPATSPVGGFGNVVDTFKVLGFRTWDAASFLTGGIIPAKESRGYYNAPPITNPTGSEKLTGFVTNPAFVFGAPAAVAAIPLFGAGAGAATASTVGGTTAVTSSTLFKTAAIAGGLGLAGGLLLNGGTRQDQQQAATVIPSQSPVQDPVQRIRYDNRQQLWQYNSTYGDNSPITAGQSPLFTPSQNPSQTASQVPTQNTDVGQSQDATSGINPWLLLAGGVAAVMLLRD